MINILIADDHGIVLDGLCSLLEKERDIKVAGKAKDGREAMKLAHELSPEVIIMDVGMPGLNGIEATRRIVAERPKVKVIALSAYQDRRFVQGMLKAGASGYLLKQSAFKELVTAIRAVVAGDIYLSPKVAGSVINDYLSRTVEEPLLTPRQLEILQLIAEGKSIKQIAQDLYISQKTAERHRAQIMAKLKVDNVAGLIKYAIREGITPLEP